MLLWNASDRAVEWTSSAPAVASVDEEGSVLGVSAGTATVTARTHDGGYEAASVVTVEEPDPQAVPVEGVALDKESASVESGKTLQLAATVSPDGATNKAVAWESSDVEVAAVSQSGLVTAGKAGSATVTVTTEDGGFKARRAITVKESGDAEDDGGDVGDKDDVKTDVSTLSISAIPDQAYTGGAIRPSVTVADGAKSLDKDTDYVLSYKNNTNVGTATVTVMGKGGYTGSKNATFKIVAASISPATIAKIASQAYTGKAVTPKPAVKLGGKTLKLGTDYALSYKNNMKVGAATVTATGKGNYAGTKSATFKIAKVTVKSVKPDKKASVAKGKTVTLKATITPSNATNKSVTWSTSDKKVATVTSKDVVKGVKAGKATITVKTKDGSKTAKRTVTVTPPVKSVKLDKKSAAVKKGKKLTLKVTVTPYDATNKNVTWKSSDKKVATVTSKGVVKGVKKGKATITVTTKDGGKKATCKVTVK